jgi:hypothetical protein
MSLQTAGNKLICPQEFHHTISKMTQLVRDVKKFQECVLQLLYNIKKIHEFSCMQDITWIMWSPVFEIIKFRMSLAVHLMNRIWGMIKITKTIRLFISISLIFFAQFGRKPSIYITCLRKSEKILLFKKLKNGNSAIWRFGSRLGSPHLKQCYYF